MKKRLFVAIQLPQNLRDVFVDYQENIRRREIRWTLPENLHITLCFLGYLEEEAVAGLIQKFESTCSKVPPFELAFEKIMFAPPLKLPRMIWALFSDKGNYGRLAHTLCGTPHAIAHVTLARFKDPSLAKGISLKQPPKEKFTVSSCDLMESSLSPKGPTYSLAHRFPFAKQQ